MNYQNRKIVLKRRPLGFPKLEDFDMIHESITEINYGEVIVKILWLSGTNISFGEKGPKEHTK